MAEDKPVEQAHRKVQLQLLAGLDTQQQPVLEKVQAWELEAEDHYELIHSPLFLRNLAAGDVFRVERDKPGIYHVVKRSGKLCIRVFSKDQLELLEPELTAEVEKLDGSLDIRTPRALVYSLHVNIGFAAVEELFNGVMARYPETVWYYGNIYDPRDGVTPLNWWDEFINQT